MLGLKLNHVSKRDPWYAKAFCITWPYWGESSHSGLPSQKAANVLLWCFPCQVEMLVTNESSWWLFGMPSLIARFVGPTWGPAWADRTQVSPMLAPWALLCVMTPLWQCCHRVQIATSAHYQDIYIPIVYGGLLSWLTHWGTVLSYGVLHLG